MVEAPSPLELRRTLLEGFEAAVAYGDKEGFTFVQDDDSERYIGFASLIEGARVRGRKLMSLGLKKGDRIALIIPEADEFVLTFLGAASVGLVAVPLYPPLSLARLDAYLEATANVLNACGARVLITTDQVAKVLWSVVPKVPAMKDLLTIGKLEDLAEHMGKPPDIFPQDPLFLQYTSGSTSAPKGVRVSHRKLCANALGIMRDGMRVRYGRDRGVSWLPLYHDMGLIGFVLAPLLYQFPIVFIPTVSFLKRPAIWIDTIHRHRATVSFGPNFAFARLLKRVTDEQLDGWDLSCVRVLGCGAEPIHAGMLRQFRERFTRARLRPDTVMPSYGMAEAVLAMTFAGMNDNQDRLRVDAIDADIAYEQGIAVPATEKSERMEVVSCGRPFEGHQIGVFADDGKPLEERKIGEIRFRGPSVASGYFDNTEASKQTFDSGGWLHTGDLGYIADGEVFISGRKKDIIIIHGKNYYPQAIEWLAEDVAGVRKGNVVAFAVPGEGTEDLVIVLETTSPAEEHVKMKQAVIRRVHSSMGVAARDVVLLRQGLLPKTSSGKVQRRKTREQYLSKKLGVEGARLPGAMGTKAAMVRALAKGWMGRLRHGVNKAVKKLKADDPAE